MSESKSRYLLETIGVNTNTSVFDLLGLDSPEIEIIRVRGKQRKVVEIPDLDVEKVTGSQDHRDNARVYHQLGEEEPKLVYPKRRL